MNKIREDYDEIIAFCEASPGGLMYQPDRRGFYNVTPEERIELWERLYNEPGFGILFCNFVEIFTDEVANEEFSNFIAAKIRERVNGAELAEKLIPKDHGFGVQRVPLENEYYEVYNRDNVQLVSLQEEAIEAITPTGIKTSHRHYDVDTIVYATGFYAGVGSYLSMDIRGKNGLKLSDKWKNGPRTLLGITVNGFPNLLMPVGPQSGASSVNYPRAIEMCVDWATALLEYVLESGKTEFNASLAAEENWCLEAKRIRDKFLSRNAKNWVNGVNPNETKQRTPVEEAIGYLGGNPKYRKLLREMAESQYAGFEFQSKGAD